MIMIYLVLNLQDSEPFVVNICTTLDKAAELVRQYKNNWKEQGLDAEYGIEEVDLYKDIAWDCYNSKFYD